MTSLPSLEDVLKIGSAPLQFHRKREIYTHEAAGLYYLASGVVRVYRTTEEGQHAHVDFYRAQQFFGFSCLDLRIGRSETAVAHSDSVLHLWPAAQIRTMLRAQPEIGMALLSESLSESARFHERMIWAQRTRIAERLRRTLLDLAERIATPADKAGEMWIEPGITHTVIAEILGTSRELTTQHLNELRRGGAIDFSRRALVIRSDRLRKALPAKRMAAA